MLARFALAEDVSMRTRDGVKAAVIGQRSGTMLGPILISLAAILAPQPANSVRILSIELSADGNGGEIRTEAERLSAKDRTYQFAQGPCKAHAMSDRVLEQLFDAMHSGSRVEFEHVTRAEAHCVQRVRFLAPAKR